MSSMWACAIATSRLRPDLPGEVIEVQTTHDGLYGTYPAVPAYDTTVLFPGDHLPARRSGAGAGEAIEVWANCLITREEE